MSLTFGGAISDRVDCGTYINLPSTMSVLLWVYPTTLTTFRTYWDKSYGSISKRLHIPGTSSAELRFQFYRNSISQAYRTNNAGITINKWWFIAVTFNVANAAGELVNIYRGDLLTLATECTYDSTSDGSGTLNDDSSATVMIGNDASLIDAFQGRIGICKVFSSELTLAQIRQQQLSLRPLDNCLSYHILGIDGTGTQRDFSGKQKTGTVTGASLGSHIPLGPPFGWRMGMPYGVLGAKSISIGDSGSGSDVLPSIASSLNIPDSGSGADIPSQLQASLSVIESATGTDSAAAFILISVSETAVGSDVVSNILATIAVSETGAGSDALPSILISFEISDSGAVSDAVTVSGGGFVTILETAFGADSVNPILASATVTEVGSGLDTTSILVTLPNISDTGVGADLIASVIKALFVSIADTGAGLDSISGLSVLVPISDSGTGVDLIGAINAVLSLVDIGVGVDIAVNLSLVGTYQKLEIKFSGKKGAVSFSGKKGRVKFMGKKGGTDFNA
jgi:hypothetical protein